MENIGSGMAALSKSAIRPIWNGGQRWIKKQPKNLCGHVISIVFFEF